MVSIIASFSKEQGKILNYSERTPYFFGYSKTEFESLKTIKDLIPPLIARNHDFFI